ncbi:MAG TPA: serine--tRNA ligase [Actinomycetota bacterium]|nr:serine--tRNA ligase [Actinomycetota bacterium]
MIDLKLLRTDPEKVRDAYSLRGFEGDLGSVLTKEEEHRRLLGRVEGLRAEQNAATQKVAATQDEERKRAIEASKEISEGVKELEQQLRTVKGELDELALALPNLVHPDAPPGQGDESNRVVKEVGTPRDLGFTPLDHLALGEGLGVIDVQRAAKVSGARFAFLKQEAALLEMAFVSFAWSRLAQDNFVPVVPPVLVREEAMTGTGFFPTDEAEVYKTSLDDLYLVGTSEVPIASMHSGEVLDPTLLPARYAGFSSCFRREAGSYGKDTRGIIRLHQFDKVEMFSFCKAADSESEHALLVSIEEELFGHLEIPYRVVEICAGDLAAPNYRKFDIEAWIPGSQRWLEITSCSNDIDYQARRLSIRTKGERGNELVHTLNGTALAVGRTLVALLENHQNADGSVTIPDALRPFAGFDEIKRPA